ncbi:phage tail assembly chaperone [Megamonas funiformis]|uniref:phage tail assembly chaperone n=1 Tax=Megamonas funiformis TaxID=437897 RepID=UPI0022E3EFF9|nr:hypothetical protein [Megamonas funiformis]
MSLVDVLLNTDVNKILQEETQIVEIERLSKTLGQKFEITIKAVPPKRYTEIQNTCLKINYKTKKTETDLYKIQMLTLCDGIKEPNFADENLLKHFNAFTPIDIFEKLFLAGEVNDIYNKIAKLSGYDKDEKEKNIEEVKN